MIIEIADYISSFPDEVQVLLKQMYEAIRQAAPEAEESINYGMPAFKTCGLPLVYFAGYKNHVGFYATPAGHEKFSAELSQYKQGKGSVQFPLDQELPEDLIKRIVEFRVTENAEKKSRKKKK